MKIFCVVSFLKSDGCKEIALCRSEWFEGANSVRFPPAKLYFKVIENYDKKKHVKTQWELFLVHEILGEFGKIYKCQT